MCLPRGKKKEDLGVMSCNLLAAEVQLEDEDRSGGEKEKKTLGGCLVLSMEDDVGGSTALKSGIRKAEGGKVVWERVTGFMV